MLISDKFQKGDVGTPLVVQWLKLHTPNARGLDSIPGQATRSGMLQLRPREQNIYAYNF